MISNISLQLHFHFSPSHVKWPTCPWLQVGAFELNPACGPQLFLQQSWGEWRGERRVNISSLCWIFPGFPSAGITPTWDAQDSSLRKGLGSVCWLSSSVPRTGLSQSGLPVDISHPSQPTVLRRLDLPVACVCSLCPFLVHLYVQLGRPAGLFSVSVYPSVLHRNVLDP